MNLDIESRHDTDRQHQAHDRNSMTKSLNITIMLKVESLQKRPELYPGHISRATPDQQENSKLREISNVGSLATESCQGLTSSQSLSVACHREGLHSEHKSNSTTKHLKSSIPRRPAFYSAIKRFARASPFCSELHSKHSWGSDKPDDQAGKHSTRVACQSCSQSASHWNRLPQNGIP
jgi:hypothetical protein